jgi:hypothetical protein
VAKRGLQRVYCTDQCRWRAGHQAAAARRREREAGWSEQTFDDLITWAEREFGAQDNVL